MIYHLGPKVNAKKVIKSLTITTNPRIKYKLNLRETSFSEGFGNTQSRSSLYYEFTLEKGLYLISSIINLENSFLTANDFEESLAD